MEHSTANLFSVDILLYLLCNYLEKLKQTTMTLQQIKDELALQHYRQPFWNLLSEHQQAMLVDIVAEAYAISYARASQNLFNR